MQRHSPCKILSLDQKIKLPKACKKRFYKHIKVVLCKKRLEKTANIRKMRAFLKLKKWPQRKGYSPCRIHSLGQKVKLPKTCEKRFYKHTEAVLCKKQLILEKREQFKNCQKWPQCKGYTQFGPKNKID